ncbi:helix-turn-helix domain-containing protein [Arcobacter lacus]|uniref:helix-turn-helix domain-containing protein n=1 Tax=Arcobacter lacus TaxID=1912876 RepID=UPI0021BA67B2|nr:helix-turn-helix domain-containing protein [Arcobacter lacus]MCT7909423.1 helix-turn-helix domain-containing protein [Arcobacter lacus]
MLFNGENKNFNKKYYVDYLINKYGKLGLTRQETANELGISLSFLDKLLREGTGLPNYRKIGRSKKPRVVFPVDAIAEFMILNSP